MSPSLAAAAISIMELSFTGSFLLARLKQAREMKDKPIRLLSLLGFDLTLGLLCSSLLTRLSLPLTSQSLLLRPMELVISRLRSLISWLMGAPAGLKLNSVLSGALGKFFLYHVHLWVTFLQLSAPHLSRAMSAGAGVLPYAGLCVQVSLTQDAFNLATFHVHCFYAYARRLFRSQTSGLLSLWRLFRGKKYNPLRDRVDSCEDNDVDRLFVGTVAFTVLLFLYPTTLMYYCVFALLELAIVAANFAISLVVRTVSRIESYRGKVRQLL